MKIRLYQNRMWIRVVIRWFITIKSAINWGYTPYNAVLIWHMYGKIQFGSSDFSHSKLLAITGGYI